MAVVRPSAPLLAFVACSARSGSTLLRLLLDAHPELACPPESDLALALSATRAVARTLGPGDAYAAATARRLAEELAGAAAERLGGRVVCDKSLSNLDHLDELAELLPSARFVCLHRSCLDVVASALEAQPFGLRDYGFSRHVAASPDDPVLALVNYWCLRTARLLAFEARHPTRCVRVRYEDLVAAPDGELARVLSHLDVTVSTRSAAAGLGEQRRVGRGDHRAAHERVVRADRVGRGWRVPVDRLAPSVLGALNGLHAMLGYAAVDSAWGSGLSAAELGPARPAFAGPLGIAVHTPTRLLVGRAELSKARWLDGEAPDGAADTARVVVEEEALADLLAGRTNPGAAMRARTLRYYGIACADHDAEAALASALLALPRGGWPVPSGGAASPGPPTRARAGLER